ncbi:MAG: hypothetical protein KJ804_08390 [Proteobacteria bacterium]|nr:hypothetical protein [Pseudomonadota bacterium]MBU1058316.1 hypothetical protein [Pseudomonadota bacterium]
MKKKPEKRRIHWLTFLPLLIFLALFLFGVNVQEPQRVLEQAWNICLDCIGIG